MAKLRKGGKDLAMFSRRSSAPLDRPAISLFHRVPPVTPRSFLAGRPIVLVVTIVAVLLLAILAKVNGGAVLLNIDEPVARWIAANRTPALTQFFNSVSHLGDNIVVFILAAITAAIVWRRCRILAIAIIGAVLLRPPTEFVLKAVIDRTRPDIEPLGHFAGPSHPSGHPLAATSFWGMLPAAVAAYRIPKAVWWLVSAAVIVIIIGVAASRTYKGAHWLTDVTASILWGSLYLLTVQGFFDRFHDQRECINPAPPAPEEGE